MSISIEESDCFFHMKKENLGAALAAALKLVQSGGYAKHCDKHWRQKIINATSIDELLNEANEWETEVEDYNIIGIRSGEYFRYEDEELFKAIAPYVESGSYINISTSDFRKFQWYFDGNTVITKEGNIDYDNNMEIVEAILEHKDLLPLLLGTHPELDKRIGEVLKG